MTFSALLILATVVSAVQAFTFTTIIKKSAPWSLPRHSAAPTFRLLYSNDEENDGDFRAGNETSSSSDDAFMTALKARMDQVSDQDTMLPIIVVDTMLPRQTLKIANNDPAFKLLMQTRIKQETPYFGIIGFAPMRVKSETQMVPLQNGVQVQIVGTPTLEKEGSGNDPKNEYLKVELKATRRFRIAGEVSNHKTGGWTQARVNFQTSQEEEGAEVVDGLEPLTILRARRVAAEFTEPQFAGNLSPVDRWIELAKTHEKTPGQIDNLLKDIGPIPPADQPSERAFWVGALINPLPGMGVAMEIRPMLLMAKTAEERTRIAMDGLQASIKHMDGSEKLF